jgi:hypothetical protein
MCMKVLPFGPGGGGQREQQDRTQHRHAQSLRGITQTATPTGLSITQGEPHNARNHEGDSDRFQP